VLCHFNGDSSCRPKNPVMLDRNSLLLNSAGARAQMHAHTAEAVLSAKRLLRRKQKKAAMQKLILTNPCSGVIRKPIKCPRVDIIRNRDKHEGAKKRTRMSCFSDKGECVYEWRIRRAANGHRSFKCESISRTFFAANRARGPRSAREHFLKRKRKLRNIAFPVLTTKRRVRK
jgi:hypothetical protein